MSKTTKIEIELPAPPEGWGEVEYRPASRGEVYFHCGLWHHAIGDTISEYPVARKLPPLWTPPPEFSVLHPGWIAMNWNKYWFWFNKKPLLGTN